MAEEKRSLTANIEALQAEVTFTQNQLAAEKGWNNGRGMEGGSEGKKALRGGWKMKVGLQTEEEMGVVCGEEVQKGASLRRC